MVGRKRPAVVEEIRASAVVSYWQALGVPLAVAEHAFCDGRRWRFDFAWPAQRVALEVQGGIWGTGPRCKACGQRRAGRHSRGSGLRKEYEKLNAAAALGWRVLFVEPQRVWHAETVIRLKQALKAGAGREALGARGNAG